MTTPSTSRKAGPLLGTGAQTTWPFTFKVFAATDIAVTIADSLGVETALVYNVDYSVTLNANQETSPGGTVTYPIAGSPLPVGTRLVIIGNLPYDQPLDLPSGGNFSPLALENQLDRTVMQVQQLRENVGRALQLPVTADGALSVQLPPPTANQLIGWDAGGSNLQNVPLADIATALAFATYRYDTFTGDGVETQFTLSADPATLGNLDIAVGGVTQTPSTDYTLLSGVLVFSSAPPLGAVILARYGEGLPPGAIGNALDVTYTPAGAGAVVRTVENRLRETVSVKDFGAVGDGVTDDTASIQAAIDAIKKENPSFSFNPIAGSVLYFPPGQYNISSTIELHDVDNFAIHADRAVLFYSGTDKAFHVARSNYCVIRGLQIQLANDGANCVALYLQASRWNTFEDLILYGELDDNPTQSTGIYLFGGPLDTNDNLYNRFRGITFRAVGWGIVLNNTDTTYTRNNANWFDQIVFNSLNGVRIIGSSGNSFRSNMEAQGTQISLERNASLVASTDNQFEFVWYEVGTSTWTIQSGCNRNKFFVQWDNNNNFPDYDTMPNAKYQIVSAPRWQQYTNRQSERYVFTPSGQFVISRADSSYSPETGYSFQSQYNVKLGASGGNNNHRVHVGTNEQAVITQDGGVGGLSLMGPGSGSPSNLVFGNDWVGTPTERWRQWLDGGTNTLNFGFGNTWKSSPTNINVQFNDTVGSGNTALLLLVNDGAVTSLRQVSVGAADSAGAGFRALRVPN